MTKSKWGGLVEEGPETVIGVTDSHVGGMSNSAISVTSSPPVLLASAGPNGLWPALPPTRCRVRARISEAVTGP